MSIALVKECVKATSSTEHLGGSEDINNSSTYHKTIDPKSIAIQSSAELTLAIRLYEQQHRFEEALAVLDDDSKAGLRSKVGRGDWELAHTKIEMLIKLEKKEEIWTFCYQLLCDAAKVDSNQEGITPYNYGLAADTLFVWWSAIDACCLHHDDSMVEKLKALLTHPGLRERQRMIAQMKLHCKLGIRDSDDTIMDLFWENICDHIKQYMATEALYIDLRYVSEELSQAESEKVMAILQEEQQLWTDSHNQPDRAPYINATLNLYKFEYSVKISSLREKLKNVEDSDTILFFAARCIKLYSVSLLDQKKKSLERGVGDEAAILAACALLHATKYHGENCHTQQCEYQAILILEKLLQNSTHNPEALSLVIRLYVRQGVWSKAWEHFQKLDVKNIQIWFNSWLILNRSATIFPYGQQGQNKELFDLLTKCARYVQGRRKMDDTVIAAYKSEKNTLGLYTAYQFVEQCRCSISKPAIFAELSRLDMRNGIKSITDEDATLDLLNNIAATKAYEGLHFDIRSFDSLPNYEHGDVESLERFFSIGHFSNEAWVVYEELMFRWQRRMLNDGHTPRTHQTHRNMAQFYLDKCRGLHIIHALKDPDTDMTPTEVLVAMVVTALSAVDESSSACQEAYVMELQHPTSVNFDWMSDYLGPCELAWKQCHMVIDYYLKDVKKAAAEFHERPLHQLMESPWKALHQYYKATEILMLYPNFLADIIDRAAVLRDIAEGKEIPLEEYDCLNVVALGAHMRTFLSTAIQIVTLYSEGARKGLAQVADDEDSLKCMTEAARGNNARTKFRTAAGHLLDEKWATEQIRPVVEAHKIAFKGIASEDSENWWKRYWIKQAIYM